jgi:hypothetical protein
LPGSGAPGVPPVGSYGLRCADFAATA